jgi:hypothetical protein
MRGSEGGPGSSDPGQYRFTAATLQDLLAVAYKPNRPGMLSNNSVSGDFMLVRFRARQQTVAALLRCCGPRME